MVQKRETEEDLKKQKRLLDVFSKKLNTNYNQFSSFSKKYRIDAYLYDEQHKNIRAWVECKWYNNKAHCFLNVPKFKELISLSEMTNLPSYLLFREHNRWGYILLHDGLSVSCTYETKLLGGTPKGRVSNDDDVEPLVAINKRHIIWGN